MRIAACALGLLCLVGSVGCFDHPEAPTVPGGSPEDPLAPPGQQPGTPPTQNGTPPAVNTPKVVLDETVYLIMKTEQDDEYICTATLVSKDRAITAAHCLLGEFVSFEIVAPGAGGKRVFASSPYISAEGDYDNDPSVPDIGFLKLDEPIDLPAYAQLTDVSERVAKGEQLTAAARVRTAEEPEAPLKDVENLALTSTADSGYVHGFATPLFTQGGDSGAGLFLVENGKVTHKLIAVARQPEPSKNRDHFTRIDAEFLQFYNENTN